MRKSIASYSTLTLTICILLYSSFSSDETIDLGKYSTEGLVLKLYEQLKNGYSAMAKMAISRQSKETELSLVNAVRRQIG